MTSLSQQPLSMAAMPATPINNKHREDCPTLQNLSFDYDSSPAVTPLRPPRIPRPSATSPRKVAKPTDEKKEEDIIIAVDDHTMETAPVLTSAVEKCAVYPEVDAILKASIVPATAVSTTDAVSAAVSKNSALLEKVDAVLKASVVPTLKDASVAIENLALYPEVDAILKASIVPTTLVATATDVAIENLAVYPEVDEVLKASASFTEMVSEYVMGTCCSFEDVDDDTPTTALNASSYDETILENGEEEQVEASLSPKKEPTAVPDIPPPEQEKYSFASPDTTKSGKQTKNRPSVVKTGIQMWEERCSPTASPMLEYASRIPSYTDATSPEAIIPSLPDNKNDDDDNNKVVTGKATTFAMGKLGSDVSKSSSGQATTPAVVTTKAMFDYILGRGEIDEEPLLTQLEETERSPSTMKVEPAEEPSDWAKEAMKDAAVESPENKSGRRMLLKNAKHLLADMEGGQANVEAKSLLKGSFSQANNTSKDIPILDQNQKKEKGNSERRAFNVRSLLFLLGELVLLLATFWYATSGNFLALQQTPQNFAVKESNMKARSDMKTPDPVELPTTPEFKTHQLSDLLIGKVRETGRKDPDPAETPGDKRQPLANLWKKIQGDKSKKGISIRSIIERLKKQKTKAQ